MKAHLRFTMNMTTPIISALLLLGGCIQDQTRPETVLTSPEHHVINGYKLLDKGMINDADREFQIALQYDPNLSSALRGVGYVDGIKRYFDPAFEAMEQAVSTAHTKLDKAMAYVGLIRLNTLRGEEGWLSQAEKYFSLALSEVKDLPDAYYYMGVAYLEAHRFVQAENAFRKVLEIKKNFVMEAEEQLKKVQNNLRREPDLDNEKRLVLTGKTPKEIL
jgi:tetratricopeptide (TPR) repeat protein